MKSFPASIPQWLYKELERMAHADFRTPGQLGGMLLMRGFKSWMEDGKLEDVKAIEGYKPADVAVELTAADLVKEKPDGKYHQTRKKKVG